MENVVHEIHICATSPPARARQGPDAQQAHPKQAAQIPMQPARAVHGFAPGAGPQGIIKKAQVSRDLKCLLSLLFMLDLLERAASARLIATS